MENKYIIGSLIGIIVISALYYYSDDMSNLMSFTSESSDLKDFSLKKIKMKPVDIKIQHLNEL